MRGYISTQKFGLLIVTILLAILQCKSNPEFTCPKKAGRAMPILPKTYSTNIRLNYLNLKQSVEVRKVLNSEEDRMVYEFWHPSKRHVKYIQDGKKVLVIKYNSNNEPTCKVEYAQSILDILEEEDAGPNKIFELLMEYSGVNNRNKFIPADAFVENGVFLSKWESCFKSPRINISLSFTENDWSQTFNHTHKEEEKYIVTAEAQMKDVFLTALFSNFNPDVPNYSEFQPPENIYCEGYIRSKKPPTMPDYFNYDSEIIVYESSFGIAPVVSHRKVYYDFPAGISRTDFYDPLAEDQDLFSTVRARGKSIIHDFKSGIQYIINPVTGQCKIDVIKATVGPVNIEETGNRKMPKGDSFFSLNAGKLTYNGQFKTRGYTADVFTARIKNSNNITNSIYTWYFSSNRTQVVENENVEKNVLLRMVIRPEAADGKEGEVEVNFYNFVKEEPGYTVYDITSCYNDSHSKTYVLTFPGFELLKGSEKLLKVYIHRALRAVAEVSKQRLFVTEVTFSGKYMFCEFKLLASPDIFGNYQKPDESTLEEAIDKLKKSINSKKFEVSIPTEEKVVTLVVEPDGIHELAGDRKINQPPAYKEGGVIALTIGMLLLGFVLGGVALNLIVGRKFGVSLCQKSKGDGYSGSLNESSM